MRKMRKLMAAVLAGAMVLSMAACTKGGDKTPTAAPTAEPTKGPTEIVTLVWGTHYVKGLDPHITDEISGEYIMNVDERTARLAAEQAVLEQLGVKFEYVQFDTKKDILQSELSGRPVSDIATLWGGSEATVLAQNVMKNLDDYEHLFRENEEMGWMLYDKLYGHYYMMSDVCRFTQRWPLVYNITMLEEAGVENPNVLFDKGEWTWSKFKEILEKVQTYYASDDNVDAYFTDFRMATLSAAFANGANIYGAAGIGVADQKMIDAVDYMNDLVNSGLLTYETYDGGDSVTPVWCLSADRFNDSRTVFAEVGDWLLGGNKNGDAVGIVPWPRPDRLAADSEEYKQCMTVGDSLCILKGVSDEKTELAIKALMLYTKTYYCTRGGVSTYAEYQKQQGAAMAAGSKFDITNETKVYDDGTTLGELILSSYNYITRQVAIGSDVSDLMGLRETWDVAIGTAFVKKTSYKTYIEENIGKFNSKLEEMDKLLTSSNFNDTYKPEVSFIKQPIAVPVGTKLTDAIWAEFISCVDEIGDGEIPVSKMVVEWNTGFDENIFATVGYYNRAFRAVFYDTAGNSDYKTVSVYVYDPANKVAPSYTLVEEPEAIKLNTDVSKINWAKLFFTSVTDANGLDISASVKADLGTIDTTVAKEQAVTLTITDFVGNTTTVTVTATVTAE